MCLYINITSLTVATGMYLGETSAVTHVERDDSHVSWSEQLVFFELLHNFGKYFHETQTILICFCVSMYISDYHSNKTNQITDHFVGHNKRAVIALKLLT